MSAVLVEEGPDAGAVWHLGEPSKEQRALEAGRAWVDLSHRPVIAITGTDRLSWLHSLTTQHLEALTPGMWTEALILSPHGHVEHQLFIVDDGTTTWMHVEPGTADALVAYLDSMRFMLRVDVRDASAEMAVFRAPGKADGYGGPYALIPRAEKAVMIEAFAAGDSVEVGTWALEAERVALGRPRLGFETDHKTLPHEMGWLTTAVHLNKGCYRGQETVARIQNLGRPPRRLVLLLLDGSEVTLPATGDPVFLEDRQVGFVGTVVRHHELGPIALALIKRNINVDAVLVANGIPATQELLVPID
jgi:tRNA-modifying protein YgfZ